MTGNRMPTRTEVEILELLAGGKERYGLEMVKASNGALKRGTVYVLLDRLEEKGFVTSREDKQPNVSGLPKRLYRITGLGAAALQAHHAASAAIAGLMPQGA